MYTGTSRCTAGWQIYWRQSMPGYQNKAKATDGTPMKNWWPMLFYWSGLRDDEVVEGSLVALGRRLRRSRSGRWSSA